MEQCCKSVSAKANTRVGVFFDFNFSLEWLILACDWACLKNDWRNCAVINAMQVNECLLLMHCLCVSACEYVNVAVLMF